MNMIPVIDSDTSLVATMLYSNTQRLRTGLDHFGWAGAAADLYDQALSADLDMAVDLAARGQGLDAAYSRFMGQCYGCL